MEGKYSYNVLQKDGVSMPGAVFSIHKYDKVKPCGIGLRESGVVQHTEAMVYAISNINALLVTRY